MRAGVGRVEAGAHVESLRGGFPRSGRGHVLCDKPQRGGKGTGVRDRDSAVRTDGQGWTSPASRRLHGLLAFIYTLSPRFSSETTSAIVCRPGFRKAPGERQKTTITGCADRRAEVFPGLSEARTRPLRSLDRRKHCSAGSVSINSETGLGGWDQPPRGPRDKEPPGRARS